MQEAKFNEKNFLTAVCWQLQYFVYGISFHFRTGSHTIIRKPSDICNPARPGQISPKAGLWATVRPLASAGNSTLAGGCQLEKLCNMGRTALSYAGNGYGELVKILLQ